MQVVSYCSHHSSELSCPHTRKKTSTKFSKKRFDCFFLRRTEKFQWSVPSFCWLFVFVLCSFFFVFHLCFIACFMLFLFSVLCGAAAKQAKEGEGSTASATAASKKKIVPRKTAKIGTPGYKVIKQKDPDTGQRSLLFQVCARIEIIAPQNLRTRERERKKNKRIIWSGVVISIQFNPSSLPFSAFPFLPCAFSCFAFLFACSACLSVSGFLSWDRGEFAAPSSLYERLWTKNSNSRSKLPVCKANKNERMKSTNVDLLVASFLVLYSCWIRPSRFCVLFVFSFQIHFVCSRAVWNNCISHSQPRNRSVSFEIFHKLGQRKTCVHITTVLSKKRRQSIIIDNIIVFTIRNIIIILFWTCSFLSSFCCCCCAVKFEQHDHLSSWTFVFLYVLRHFCFYRPSFW